jgi:hypothetical protein
MQILTTRNTGALNNAPVAKAIFDPKEAILLFDDFRTQIASADTDKWNITIGSSTTAVAPGITNAGGVLTLTPTASVNVSVDTWGIFQLAGSTNLYFEANVAVGTIAASGSVFIGLSSLQGAGTTPVPVITTAGAMDGTNSGVGFTITAATIRGVAGIGAAIGTPVVLSTAAVASTFYRLGMKIEGLNRVSFYLNGVFVGSIEGSAYIPTAVLYAAVCTSAVTAVKTVSVDHILIACDR